MSVLAFARAANAEPATDIEATKQSLTDFLNAVNKITGYSHAVSNTVLAQITDPKPEWFDPLSKNLETMKTHAQDWVDNVAPSMTSVPQAVINFDNSFEVRCQTIMTLLDTIGENPATDEQKRKLKEEMDALLDELKLQQSTIKEDQDKLTQYKDNLSADHKALTTGAASITEAINKDKEAVKALNDDIENLKWQISIWDHVCTASEIQFGTAVVFSLVLFFRWRSGTASGGDVFLPLALFGEATAGTILSKEKIRGLKQKIDADAEKISDENKQIAHLNEVAATVNSLVDNNNGAMIAMDKVVDKWNTLTSEMQKVVDDLANAEGDIGKVIDKQSMTKTKDAWTDLMRFATQMQITLTSITLMPPEDTESAAA
jgi:predicted  nucleic acid-binding Zn-ribbon protein